MHRGVNMQAIRTTDFIEVPGLHTDYIIPSLVPRTGRIALYGIPKKGKSFLAFQLAQAVSDGGLFITRQVVYPGPVLYMQFDTPPALWQERLIVLSNAQQPIDGKHGLFVIHPATQPKRVNILDGSTLTHIHSMISHVQPVLIVVDVLASIHRMDENRAGDMKLVVDRLTGLASGRALLIVHHTAKPNLAPGAGEHTPSSAGRGSSYLGGEVDANWLLKGAGPTQARLSVESRFASPMDDIPLTQTKCGIWVVSSPHHTVAKPLKTDVAKLQQAANANLKASEPIS
jgi:RecA-family ATPase